jgi:glycosyltransferase involved in cell wall biosynthesis
MPKKNRIILWESLPNIAGGQRVALNIVSRLKERYDFEFILPSKGPLSEHLESKNIKVHYIEMGTYQLGKKSMADIIRFLWLTPAALWKSYGIIRGADLLYANSSRLFVWSAIIGSITGVPVIWHLHNILVDRRARALVEFFGKFRSVKRMIAVSNATKDQYVSLRSKIDTVYNGIDTARFRISAEGEDKGGEKERKKIGIIADLIPIKGHDTLFRAFALIREKVPVKLMVVGSYQEHLRSYAEELREFAERLGLNEDILFMGQRSDIPEILNSLDLVVISSSMAEACPMVALEAFACGVPVVGPDIGGTPELIEDGKTGFVFRANDETDLAEKIILILDNPELHAEMKEECRKVSEEKFALDIFSGEIERIIEKSLPLNSKGQ